MFFGTDTEKQKRHAEWLAGLKPGDDVVVRKYSIYGSVAYVAQVTKVTKVGGGRIHVGNQVFRSQNGDLAGSYHHTNPSIEEPTPEALHSIKMGNLRGEVKKSLETLTKIIFSRELSEETMNAIINLAQVAKNEQTNE